MFEFLENLRQKPVGVRKRIAFFSALVVALAIFGIWMTTVFPDVHTTQSQQAKAAALEPSPFSALANTLSSGFSGISEQINAIKNTVSSITPAPAYYVATSTDNVATSTGE